MNTNYEMFGQGQELIVDEDDQYGQINYKPQVDFKIEKNSKNIKGPKTQQGRNFTALQTIAAESKAEDLMQRSDSENETKIIMPVKHAPEIV